MWDRLHDPVCDAREELVRSFSAHFPGEEFDCAFDIPLCLQDRYAAAVRRAALHEAEIH